MGQVISISCRELGSAADLSLMVTGEVFERAYILLRISSFVSSRKRKKQGSPMSSAGLVRFYEEENLGLKLKPGYILAISAVFAVVIAVAHHIF